MRKLVPGISIPQCKFIIDEKTGLHISIEVSATLRYVHAETFAFSDNLV